MVPCQIMQTQATIHKSGWEKFTDRKKKKKITSFHTYSDLKYKDHGTILTSNSPHLSSAQDVVLNQRCNRSQISHIVGFD